MGIDISGVEDTMQIQQAETRKKIAEYVRNQLQEDIIADQLTIKEYIDPFTGSKSYKA